MSDKISGVQKREEALAQMRSALMIIDAEGGPADVGAHLDLAICRLEATFLRGPVIQSDNFAASLRRVTPIAPVKR